MRWRFGEKTQLPVALLLHISHLIDWVRLSLTTIRFWDHAHSRRAKEHMPEGELYLLSMYAIMGQKNAGKVLRLLVDVSAFLEININTWVAVPRPNVFKEYLFATSDESTSTPHTLKEQVESILRSTCYIPTVGQTCA